MSKLLLSYNQALYLILGVDETVSILLKYKSGAIANLTSNMTLTGENAAVIYGDKGTIKVRPK